jgi:hypothetical protein
VYVLKTCISYVCSGITLKLIYFNMLVVFPAPLRCCIQERTKMLMIALDKGIDVSLYSRHEDVNSELETTSWIWSFTRAKWQCFVPHLHGIGPQNCARTVISAHCSSVTRRSRWRLSTHENFKNCYKVRLLRQQTRLVATVTLFFQVSV